MSEKAIEKYLRDEVKKQGGKAFKFVSPGNAGVPDRIVIFPGGHIIFVELKADPSKSLTTLQEKRIKELRALDCSAIEVKSKDDVDRFIECSKEALGI